MLITETLDISQVDVDFAKTEVTSSKTKARTVNFVYNLFNYNKDELISVFKGTATWQDGANLVASLASAGAYYIPLVGPIASMILDITFSGLIANFGGSGPTPEEVATDAAKQVVMNFFQNLTTGKLIDVATALTELKQDVEDVKANAKNYASFVSQYNILYSQISSLFNSIITQDMNFRMYTLQIFRDAVQLYMVRVLSLQGMKKTLGMTTELCNTLDRHMRIGQFLYLKGVHVDFQEKFNRLLNAGDIIGYFNYRNLALKSFQGIYPQFFANKLFPGGVIVDNPTYYYKVLLDPNSDLNDPSLFRSLWDAVNQLLGGLDNFCYMGNLTGLTVGITADNRIIMVKTLGQNKKTTDWGIYAGGLGTTSTTPTLALDKTAEYQKVSLGWGDIITVGGKSIGTKATNNIDPSTFDLAKENITTCRIGQIHTIRLGKNESSLQIPIVGYIDKDFSVTNYLYGSTTTVIAPCKYISKVNATSNFDDVFIGFNSMQLATNGELLYEFTPNSSVTKFTIYLRITCGYHTQGLLGTTSDVHHQAAMAAAQKKAIDDSLPLVPLKLVYASEDSEITVIKKENTANPIKKAIPKAIYSKLFEIDTIDFNNPAKNNLKIICSKGNVIIEALIFSPVK